MSDNFGFCDRYLSTDGKEYVDADCVREALGIVDEYVDILGVIKKLREERHRAEADFKRERDLLRTEIDNLKDNIRIKNNVLKTVKKERDELKEKCDKLKKRANAAYGVSCGYSGDKAPAFLCDVISYGWEFGSITDRDLMDRPTYRVRNNSIRVELELTPTANYNGTLDMEDLKKYIQEYGREKKLGVLESVDYQNAKVARSELAYLYKQVLGKERLDRDLSPHEVMKAIHDEYKRVRDSQLAFSQCLRSVYMHVHENTGYDVSDIYAAPDKLADGIITRYNSTRMSSRLVALSDIDDHIDELCDKYTVVKPDRRSTTKERLDYIFAVINEEYKRVVHNFEERTADWSKAQQEYSRYRLAIGSLLDIPKETRDDINAIERSFTFSKKKYESLKEFRDNVCEIFDIPSSMADDQEQIVKEIHDFADRYYELKDFRADICEVLGIDADELFGSPQQNDKYILAQAEKMKDNMPTVFRNDVAVAIGMTPKDSNPDIIKRVMEIRESHDRLARLRSDICTALCLGHEDCDGNIIGRIHMMQDCHEKLCEDYTELRKAIWDAMDRKPETLPDETARLVGEVTELARGEKLLIGFRDDVAKAIGMNYPTTNQVILNNVKYIYKDREDAYGMVASLNDHITELEKAKDDLQQKLDTSQKQVKGFTNRCDSLEDLQRDLWKLRRNAIEDLKSRGFCFRPEENDTLPEIYDKLLKRYDWAYGEYKEQYRLRQMWHVRWESENERANGVQKALDREREKCRVKDISLETAKKQYEKVCSNLETAECALNGMKSKVRSLQEEKTKVISALGQDIWDDCVK